MKYLVCIPYLLRGCPDVNPLPVLLARRELIVEDTAAFNVVSHHLGVSDEMFQPYALGAYDIQHNVNALLISGMSGEERGR